MCILAVDLFFPYLLQALGKILQTGLQHQALYSKFLIGHH